MRNVMFHNADKGWTARTILAGCYKFGAATLLREGGATMTSVIEIYEHNDNAISARMELGGGLHQMHTCPSLTISGWQSNNFIIDTYMTDYSEIELKPDSKVTPLGNCQYDIDGRTIEFRIRKLTPTECYKLMDVPENVIDTLMQKDESGKQIISNSQHYRLAGNSIVCSCLYYLFEQIWYPKEPTSVTPKQLTLF